MAVVVGMRFRRTRVVVVRVREAVGACDGVLKAVWKF